MRRLASAGIGIGAAAVLAGCGGVIFGRPMPPPTGVPGRTATEVAVAAPPAPALYPFTAILKPAPRSAPEEDYSWLENVNSPRTREWIVAENHFSERELAATPQRAWIARRLERLTRSTPARATQDFVTEHVFYLTPIGKRLPMVIAYRRGLARDGDRPAILTVLRRRGALTPAIKPRALVWLEMGGVYAAAFIPGEAQFDKAPRGRATLAVRAPALKDLRAAAQYLVEHRYTRTGRLAIYGRGYGGLLAGALLTRYPQYFAVVLPTGTWAEYRNLEAGTCYPPTLIMTAVHDGILRPWRGFELAAALQSTQVCGHHPILIRIRSEEIGDGAAAPVRIAIDADALGFAARWLGVPVPRKSP